MAACVAGVADYEVYVTEAEGCWYCVVDEAEAVSACAV